MKFVKLLGALVLSVGMLVSPVMAEEADSDPYTYTVRIYRGNHGHFASDPDAEYIEFERGYGEELPAYNVQDLIVANADNDKPYVPSTIKLSGEDVLETENLYLGGTKVTSDQDYVVTYSLLLDPVEYTINYMDVETGQPIEGMASSKYTGNLGEQIVLSFPYIEGYSPQALNGRITLKEGTSHNFNFWYEPVEGPTVIPGNATTVTDTETETVTTTPGTITTPGTTTPGTTTPGADTTTPGGDDTTTPGGEDTTPNEPQDVIDIEDDNVPLAGPDANEPTNNADAGMSLPAKLGLGAVLVLLVAGIIYFLVKKKKDNE